MTIYMRRIRGQSYMIVTADDSLLTDNKKATDILLVPTFCKWQENQPREFKIRTLSQEEIRRKCLEQLPMVLF